MARNNWVLHFVRDFEACGLLRIKVFVGRVFAGSIWQSPTTLQWSVSLFEDWNSSQHTDCFEGKQYKTLNGAKSAVSRWIRRNWSVNMKGGKK